jgi:DNA-binding transcriptional MerR regulator
MRQLDLFGSFFDAPTEQKTEEKKPVAKKEEKLRAEDEAVAPYSMVGLAEEMLSKEDPVANNSSKKESKKELENLFLFHDHLVPITDVVSEQEARKIQKSLPIIGTGEVLEVELKKDQPTKKTERKEDLHKPVEQKKVTPVVDDSIIFSDGKITVKLKKKPPVVTAPASIPLVAPKEKTKKVLQKRGRKSFKEIDADVDLIEIPEDDVLFQKQYYPISEVAKWFRVNTSLLRFWENEFDVLKPRKNRKGDRLFRPEDVKNLQLIYQLLRQRKYTIEGAKEYIKTNRKKADMQQQLTQTLQKFKSFLLDLKANLQP